MERINIKYKDLKANDIIWWHGALERVVDTRSYIAHDGERVVNFNLEPYNEESIQILGKFYSHGWYGGCEWLPVTKVIM